MIAPMSAAPNISLDTRILDLPAKGVPGVGSLSARKLALGLAEISSAKDINSVTIEDSAPLSADALRRSFANDRGARSSG
jgi:hypothetical protein